MISPLRPTDAEARALARQLIRTARSAALAVTEAETGLPFCSRIALACAENGLPFGFISGLAQHSRALQARPECCLLIGAPGEQQDPLAQPRLSLQARAVILPPDDPQNTGLKTLWLARHPTAGVYADLPDFRFVQFQPLAAFLNGGFGRAFRLSAEDLPG